MENHRKQSDAHRHARSYYYIVGEGMCPVELNFQSIPGMEMPRLAPPTEPPPTEDEAFRFCRMFPKGETNLSDAALIALGMAMDNSDNTSNSNIPAGFTYLGQFIDHDITFDKQSRLDDGEQDPALIENSRSPFLDLDSVYGLGPQNEKSKHLYHDGVHLKIGPTTGRPIFGVTESLPNDLPRNDNGEADIADPRNDENLAVAQTHLALLKFHNSVADGEFANIDDSTERFDKTRKLVVQHYQSIVLHDFLPRITDPTVYDDVMNTGVRKFYNHKDRSKPAMPVEFSVAAYRLGHSMIRNDYEWNRIFTTAGDGPVATLGLLFRFSGVSGDLGGSLTLPTDWIIDWTRFYDFSDVADIENCSPFNRTQLITPNLAVALENLPEFRDRQEVHKRSLAARNLLRGRLVSLPTGQEVAAVMGVTPLTPDEIKVGRHAAILEANGFLDQTPLWYYILKEAQVQQQGQRLGEVGSRIVVETFHGLVEVSRDSILQQPDWEPSLPSAKVDHFTMADLLAYVDDVNPLG